MASGCCSTAPRRPFPTAGKSVWSAATAPARSTLLRLIQGQIEADSGEINLMGRTRVGSVPQDPPGGDIRVIDAVLAADVERSALLAEDATCHDGVRLAEIRARLGKSAPRLRPRARPRS